MPLTIEEMADALTIDEFAEVLRVSRRTAERIVTDPNNGIDYVRVGVGRGQLRIPRRSANDYLARNFRRAPANTRTVKTKSA